MSSRPPPAPVKARQEAPVTSSSSVASTFPPPPTFETLPSPPNSLLPPTKTPVSVRPAELPHWLRQVLALTMPPPAARALEQAPPRSTLTNADRERLFGRFSFKATPAPNDAERILVDPTWVKNNIVTRNIPALRGVQNMPYRGVDLHKRVMPHFEALISAWEEAGLLSKILTWNGGYVPRFRRGQAEKRVLSAHSWGSAFDINARWNPFRKPSAPENATGSVRELVAIARRLGWTWGGDFNDPMHFEAGAGLFANTQENVTMDDPKEKAEIAEHSVESDAAQEAAIEAEIDAKIDAMIANEADETLIEADKIDAMIAEALGDTSTEEA